MDTNDKENISQAAPDRLADLLAEGLANGDSRPGSEETDSAHVRPRDGAVAAALGSSLPDYEIIRELHRGGQGVVYEALQKTTKRKVAIKVLLHGLYAGEAARKRFAREIELVGQLRHPNIITIFDAGETEEGLQFYVMEYVDGVPLHQYARKTRLTLDQALGLFQKVCDAVQYAHQRGVLHRDLKPSNVLVDTDGEPKVLDFGLAKPLAGPVDTLVSLSQQIIGTLPYMSPEQAGGKPEEVDTRSDVYALGVVLYELLTGRYPYPVVGRVPEVLRNIADTPPSSVRSAWRSEVGVTPRITRRRGAGECPIDSDVETILLMALAKERERRYQSAGELARDIRHYLAGEAIEAGRDSGWYVLRKTLQRHKLPLAGAVVFLMLLGGSAISLTKYQTQQRLSAQLTLERDRAVSAVQTSRRALYSNRIALAQIAQHERRGGDARGLLEQCPEDLRGWEWDRLHWLADRSIGTLRGHEGEFKWGEYGGVRCAAFSPPDGRWIVSGGWDTTLRIWDAATYEQVGQPLEGHTEPICSVAYSPDGKWIASGSKDKTLKIWNAAAHKEARTLIGHKDAVRAVACSPSKEGWIVSGSNDKTLRLWNASTGEAVRVFSGHQGEVTSVAFSPDGARIASGSYDNTVIVWETDTGRLMQTIPAHDRRVTSVSFCPDPERQWILSSSFDSTVKIWDVAGTYKEVRVFEGDNWGPWVAAFGPKGKRIASGGSAVRIADVATGEEGTKLLGHQFPIVSIKFSADGQRIVTASQDYTVKVWDANAHADPQRLLAHSGTVNAVSISSDGNRIASAGADEVVRIWDAGTNEEIWTLRGHQGTVSSVAFAQVNKWIVSGGVDGTVRVWNANTGQSERILRGHQGSVSSVAIDPDSMRIVSGSVDKTVRVWDVSTGNEVLKIDAHEDGVRSVAFSPDGTRIASGSTDCTVRLWNAATKKPIWVGEGHEHPVTSVAFSPDGTRVASASWDNTIRIWDALTGGQTLRIDAPKWDVYSVAFSPDGTRIASASADRTVRLWDAVSGTEVLTLRAHKELVSSVAFSAFDARIVSGDWNGMVLIWNSGTRPDLVSETSSTHRRGGFAATSARRSSP